LPFIGDGLTYLMSAFLFRAAIPVRPHSRSRGEVSLVADVRSGLRLFLGNRSLLVLAAAVSTFAFCQAMVFSVVVLYATRVLHLHEIGFGLLLCVAAIGNIASSLMASRVRNALGSVGTVIGAGIVAAGGYLLLGGTRNVVLAGLALTLESTGTGVGNVATFSLRQALIPVERFGLVNNAFRTCLSGIVPLGALIGGALTTSFGTRTTFFVAGTFQLVALALMAFPLRGVPARQVEP
jgi:Na+/melibiose symporter-like transporter